MKENNLLSELKKGFNQIIDYHITKGELHARAERDVRRFVNYLLDQTDSTVIRLIEVIQKHNYETITPDADTNAWPDLEFWRGMDGFGSTPALNFDGSQIWMDDEPILKSFYEIYTRPNNIEQIKENNELKSIKIDFEKYPISHLGYYEYRLNEAHLFHAWIGYLWQEIDGYKCGIQVKTVENNSVKTYSLNDFVNGDFSIFVEGHYEPKPKRIENYFPRKLSFIELYQRAAFSFTFNPFSNQFRYFQKGDKYIEVGTYGFSTGIRQGIIGQLNASPLENLVDHKTTHEVQKYINDITTNWIFKGWEEILRPLDMPSKMHDEAFEFEISSYTFYNEDPKNINPEEKIIAFEERIGSKLPRPYYHYLRYINWRESNNSSRHYPINNLYTVQVIQFYNIRDLYKNFLYFKDTTHLWIGMTADDNAIGICIDKDNPNYDKLVIANQGNINVCDYSFEKFMKYAQFGPVQPEIFAAQENDVAFLKKRIDEGWDYNTKYGYQNAVTQAAASNSHETLEILLDAGARLDHDKHRDMPWQYDEKTMDILDKYN